MWTTVVCRIVELDEWSLCSPSAKGTLYGLTCRAWAICAEVWMSYSYTWNGVHLKRGCENMTSVRRCPTSVVR